MALMLNILVFQWVLQGTECSACDFIGVKEEQGLSQLLPNAPCPNYCA